MTPPHAVKTEDFQSTIAALAGRLRTSMHIRPILLLGAGASVSSGVPSARTCVLDITRNYLINIVRTPEAEIIAGDDSLLEDWIWKEDWASGYKELAELFPIVVDKFLNPTYVKTRFLIEKISVKKLSVGYRHLKMMVDRHVFKTIITTNFDECLPAMFYEKSPQARVTEVGRWPNDIREYSIDNKQIIWMHGRLEQYSARNTALETEKLDDSIAGNVKSAMREAPLIVVGYRGFEKSMMDNFLNLHADEFLFYKHGIYWCTRDLDPHPNVTELAEKVGKDFFLVPISTFDDAMEDLNWATIETDHTQPSRFKGWSKWIDCLSENSMRLYLWRQSTHDWRKHEFSKVKHEFNSKKELDVYNNLVKDPINHIQFGFAELMKDDFEIDIEISGDYYDIKLQYFDLTDRSVYITPNTAGIDYKKRNRYSIIRVGEQLMFGVWRNSRRETIDLEHYGDDKDVSMQSLVTASCFINLTLFKDGRLTIHHFRVRTSKS